MGNQYCAISTKLQAMHAGFLEQEDYEKLLEKKSVPEICAYLKNTVYAPYLADVSEYEIHRSALEEHLDRRFDDEYSGLYTFANLQQKKLLRFFYIRAEIDYLKKLLRSYYNHEAFTENQIVPEALLRHSKIDFSAIRQGNDLSVLANACRETPYFSALRYAAAGNSDYAGICMLLDQTYFKMLWRSHKKYLPEKEQNVFAELIGSEIDTLNLVWLYRCKKYFNLPNELIYTYLIPVYYRLKQEEIAAMAEAQSPEECAAQILKTRYARIFEGMDETGFLEQCVKQNRYRQARKMFRLYPQTMTEIYALLELKQIELQNLDTIIEGVRYHISAEIIRGQIYTGR